VLGSGFKILGESEGQRVTLLVEDLKRKNVEIVDEDIEL